MSSSDPRVAVVGTGIAGLVAAHELHGAGVAVTVFEAGPRPGGHSNTVRVETDSGAWDVDTGFIVLNDRNYPRFQALLDELGVQTKPAPMSFSVADGLGDFEWATASSGRRASSSLPAAASARMSRCAPSASSEVSRSTSSSE